jgi:hypothetical protein
MPEGKWPTFKVSDINTLDNLYVLEYIDSRYETLGSIIEFSKSDCELFYTTVLKDKRNHILEELLNTQ